jgi:hypothetical protein
MDYHIVAQGKTTIPSVDDGEEMELTDVRLALTSILKRKTIMLHYSYRLHIK